MVGGMRWGKVGERGPRVARICKQVQAAANAASTNSLFLDRKLIVAIRFSFPAFALIASPCGPERSKRADRGGERERGGEGSRGRALRDGERRELDTEG